MNVVFYNIRFNPCYTEVSHIFLLMRKKMYISQLAHSVGPVTDIKYLVTFLPVIYNAFYLVKLVLTH